MGYLAWISDDDLVKAVERMADAIIRAKESTEKNIARNVIDPFSLLFNIALLSGTAASWKKSEIIRQVEKGLTNAIGNFHQEIIAHVPGWRDPSNKQDFDLINDDKKIVVEMKNKYNTLNAEGQKNCFNKLSSAVSNKNSSFYQYQAYCVNIVPRQGRKGIVPFVVKDNSTDRHLSDDRVAVVDGETFYTLATGETHALHNLFCVLPKVMTDRKIAKFKPDTLCFIEQIFQETYSSCVSCPSVDENPSVE